MECVDTVVNNGGQLGKGGRASSVSSCSSVASCSRVASRRTVSWFPSVSAFSSLSSSFPKYLYISLVCKLCTSRLSVQYSCICILCVKALIVLVPTFIPTHVTCCTATARRSKTFVIKSTCTPCCAAGAPATKPGASTRLQFFIFLMIEVTSLLLACASPCT